MQDPPTAQKIVDLMAQSISLGNENRYEEALGRLDEALKIDPNFFPVLVRRGTILNELRRYEEAVDSFDRVLKFTNLPHACQLCDKSLLDALEECERILTANPEDTEALLKQGDIQQRLHRYGDAVHSYNLVLRVEAKNIDALNRRGNAFLELGRHEDALESYERALEIAPYKAALLFNRGNVLQQLGRLDEALENYSRALSLKPDLAEAVMEQSHCNLALGRFQTGWRQYESRWQTGQLKGKRLDSPKPLWLGEEQLWGKTILLWAEQGFGDTIQFLRYVPLVAQMAAHVIVRVSVALKCLAGTLRCPVSIITRQEPLPFRHFHCPLMSLPLAFGTVLESIPADVPYLGAKDGQIEKWHNLLGPRDKFRIGVVWAGRQQEPLNKTRDIPLEVLEPLAKLDVEIISLQKHIPEEDREVLESLPQFRRLGESLTDFADRAALIENLDMVISTDTAVAHLAGALGRTVWIMLRHSSEWRWLLERSDSPWYPTVRIFRQRVRGDWDGVVREITEQLRARLCGE